jgi:hypothetical protein
LCFIHNYTDQYIAEGQSGKQDEGEDGGGKEENNKRG